MIHKPYNINKWEELHRKAESGSDGYYPIGTGDFWHSGVHIEGDSLEEHKPIVAGKAAAYRFSKEYKKTQLLRIVSAHEYSCLRREDKDKYEVRYSLGKGYQVLKDEYLETDNEIEISDNFVLLKHEYNAEQLSQGKLCFYTLYENLAPLSEVPEEKKELFEKVFECNGQTHTVAEDKMEYVCDMIYAGKRRGRRYIEFAVLQEESVFKLKEKAGIKDAERRYIFERNRENKVYKIEKEEEEKETEKYMIPSHTEYKVVKEFEYKGRTYRKVEVESMRLYLVSEQVNGKNEQYKIASNKQTLKITGAKPVTFYDKTIDFSTGGKGVPETCRYLYEKLRQGIQSISAKKEWAIEGWASGQPGIRVRIGEDLGSSIVFWTKGEPAVQADGKLAVQTIGVNESIPVKLTLAKTDNTEETEQVTGIRQELLLDKDENEYKKVEGIEGRYIKAGEERQWVRNAFDWEYYFINKADKAVGRTKGIRCDRKALLAELDETDWIKEVVGESEMRREELYCIFGGKEGFEGAEELRKKLRKVVCRHPIEWNEENYTEISLNAQVKKEIEEEAKIKDVWKGGLSEVFKAKEPYFMHPYYFLEHMEKAGVLTFNPYEGKTYKEIYKNTSLPKEIKGSDKVMHNPGFAPVWKKGEWSDENPNCNGYACITGFFNEDYLDVKRGNGKTYKEDGFTQFTHEGVDFRGHEGTEIHSLIYGTVLGYGTFGTYGNTIFIANKNGKGIYLLAHLKDYNKGVLDKKDISPGTTVGYVGKTGGDYVPHLHVTYFDYKYDTEKKIVSGNGGCITPAREYSDNIVSKKYNPFKHNDIKLQNKR